MSRPISGEEKTYQVKVRRSNGTIYVYERREVYRDGRMRKAGKDRLIGKILPDDPEQKIVPTRPKRASQRVEQSTFGVSGSGTGLQASRVHIGSSEILDAVSEKYGIEADIYDLLERGTAQKLISCARFLVCTDGECLSHIQTWQLTHPIPYAEGLSKDTCHRLTEELGLNESFRMGLFQKRILRQEGDVLTIAYDGSTVSTYSENQIDARYGFNKANDGLKTIKILALYASETCEPLGFTKQPGNLPDVISVQNALAELSVLTSRRILLVADNGFYSEGNAYDLISEGYSFLLRVEITTKWVREYLDKLLDDVLASSCSCSDDGFVAGLTKTVVHVFTKTSADGTVHSLRKRAYLHFFCDHRKRTQMNADMRSQLKEIADLINSGTPVSELSKDAQKLAKAHIHTKQVRKKSVVYIDDASVSDVCRYDGIFAVLGYGSYSQIHETQKAYRTYINREHIEDHFRAEKQSVDGNTVRSWYGTNYLGRLTVQFVGLLYEDCLLNEIKRIKRELQQAVAESKATGKGKTVAGKKEKLLKWLNKQSLFSLLSWFDAIEETKVSSQIRCRRWNTETTERDRMFLEMIGVPSDILNT